MNAQNYEHHQVGIYDDMTAVRINVGGENYTDANGKIWLTDQFFIDGKAFSTSSEIINTSNDPLYQTERWGKQLKYVVPVNNGNYTVNLGFAEIWANSSGIRVFDIKAENQLILDDFDIYKEAGGKHIALNKSFPVVVTDGELNLDFLASANNAKLSAIEIIEDTMPEKKAIKHRIQGTFASEGFLANGHFSGWFSYNLETSDINESVTNSGQFEISEFQIDVFDASNNLVDTLSESNSKAFISLQDTVSSDGQADTYILSTVQKTAGDDFFEHGEFHLTFDWPIGGDPKLAPSQAPQDFKEAYFSSYAAAGGWEGIVNPQQVRAAHIEDKASSVVLGLQGSFANAGFLANGNFEGWFAYDANAADINESITNVGSFDLDNFQISVFDAAGNLVNTLDDTNSTGQVSLRDVDPVDEAADTYLISIIPDTVANSNAFFELGELNITFDWALGGNPNISPIFVPQAFEVGNFASYANAGGWEGVINPQQVQAATVSLFDISNFALEPIRVEAETMELTGYRIESSRFASDEKLVSLFGRANNETGSAAMTFSGPPGKYTVVVGYVEENDGEATLEVAQNGNSVGSWQLTTQGQGSAGVTANNFLRHTVATELNIRHGDEFTILGIEEGAEHARVDYIEFIPVVASEDVATPAIENGLNATYFSDRNLQNPALNRIDTTIDFLWGNSSPDPTLPKDNFSVRWSGYIAPEYSETYQLSTSSDDGIRLWVGDDLLINNWTRHAQTIDRGYIALEAGKMYPITLEYFEGIGQAASQLSWSSNSQELEIVPQNHLFVSNGLDVLTTAI